MGLDEQRLIRKSFANCFHLLVARNQASLSSVRTRIDESLNWRPHIHTISKKISAGITILRRVSHFIPFDTRVNMYNALVMPYFIITVVPYGVISIRD